MTLYYRRNLKKTFINKKVQNERFSVVSKKACVHVVVINNWFPELCSLTLPLIEKWASNINADFNLITQPKFNDYPPNYERFQIFESGQGYEWNINIDADFIVHPELEDVTDNDPMVVRAEAIMKADHFFYPNMYFLRDGRNVGMSDNFILSSHYTHDVWTPLNMSYAEAKQHCTLYERQVSEFAVSLNIARFGLKCSGCVKDKSKLYHIQSTGSGMSKEDIIDLAKMKMKEMSIC
jgi:hypothetical protein